VHTAIEHLAKHSMTSKRIPLKPSVSTFARSNIIARTRVRRVAGQFRRSDYGTRIQLKLPQSSCGTRTSESLPKPVFDSVNHGVARYNLFDNLREAAMRGRADREIVTCSSPIATAAICSRVERLTGLASLAQSSGKNSLGESC